MALRISESLKLGSFRIRLSAPLTGKGRPRVTVGTKVGRGRVSVSETIGGRRKAR
jgi:hypothetical protein